LNAGTTVAHNRTRCETGGCANYGKLATVLAVVEGGIDTYRYPRYPGVRTWCPTRARVEQPPFDDGVTLPGKSHPKRLWNFLHLVRAHRTKVEKQFSFGILSESEPPSGGPRDCVRHASREHSKLTSYVTSLVTSVLKRTAQCVVSCTLEKLASLA
jgi:hypothetical protein